LQNRSADEIRIVSANTDTHPSAHAFPVAIAARGAQW
jgi:hypothetical protein